MESVHIGFVYRGGLIVRRQMLGLCGLAAIVGLSGCGGIKLNEKQTAEAAEYASSLYFKYDKNYTDVLIYPEETADVENPTVAPESTPKVEEDQSEGAQEGQTDSTETTLAQACQAKGFSISCRSIKTTQEYKDSTNKGLAVYAEKGKTIAVVTFDVTNDTNKQKRLYQLEKGIQYDLELEDGTQYTSELSLLTNDMNFLNMKFKAGETKKCVVFFQIPKNKSIKNASLKVTGATHATSIAVN